MNWVALTALGGTVAACWSKVRLVFNKLFSVIFAEVQCSAGVSTSVEFYCWKHGKRSPLARRIITGAEMFIAPLNRKAIIGWEAIGSDPVLFFIKRRPIIMLNNSGGLNGPSASGNPDQGIGSSGSGQSCLKLIYIRGTLNIDKFIVDAIDNYNETKLGMRDNKNKEKKTRFQIYMRHGSNGLDTTEAPMAEEGYDSNQMEALMLGQYRLLKWKTEDLIPITDNRDPFESFPFPPNIVKAIEEIKLWKESEKWFTEKRIPWRRGWLLYGEPGTGKSSLSKFIAQHLDMPIYLYDISSMSNEQFVNDWQRMQRNAPCIALIEDIDAVFHGRKNIYAEKAGNGMSYLTFDCLLNCISGVNRTDGVFVIITTNNVDKLDPALGIPSDTDNEQSTRPGRLDRMLYLGAMHEGCRRKVAQRILADWPELVEENVKFGDGMVAAQFEDHLCQIALKKFWHEYNKTEKQKELVTV